MLISARRDVNSRSRRLILVRLGFHLCGRPQGDCPPKLTTRSLTDPPRLGKLPLLVYLKAAESYDSAAFLFFQLCPPKVNENTRRDAQQKEPVTFSGNRLSAKNPIGEMGTHLSCVGQRVEFAGGVKNDRFVARLI